MYKHEQQLPVQQATVKHEVHEDHVIVIIGNESENQFRCRIDRADNQQQICEFIESMQKWINELNHHVVKTF